MTRLQPTMINLGVPTESYNVGKLLGNLIIQVHAQKGKGLSTGQELTAILAAEVGDFLLALQGAAEIAAEAKEDPILFGESILIPLLDGLRVLTK